MNDSMIFNNKISNNQVNITSWYPYKRYIPFVACATNTLHLHPLIPRISYLVLANRYYSDAYYMGNINIFSMIKIT